MSIRFIIFFFIPLSILAQNQTNIDSVLISTKLLEFEKARNQLKRISNDKVSAQLSELINIIENRYNSETVTPDIQNKQNRNALDYLVKGYLELPQQRARDSALEYFNKCFDLSSSKEIKAMSLIGCIEVYKREMIQPDSLFFKYLNQYKAYTDNPIDAFWHQYYSIELSSQERGYDDSSHKNESTYKSNLISINQLRSQFKKNKRILLLIEKLNGDYYVKFDGKTARSYYNNCKELLDNSPYFEHYKFRLNLDIARSFATENNYQEAINQLHSIKKDSIHGQSTINNLNYHFFLYEYHEKLKRFDSAVYYLKEIPKLERNIKLIENRKTISSLETKLGTAEKERLRIQNRNIAFGLGFVLLFISVLAFLIQKNTKRKQLLAERDKALESQKLATVLKEQELKSIDAMIAGQEKERQRIANDLHDDLGSLMANVKLHFDALKDNPSPELYTKANSLIETAYHKIRGMAHAKNSGVMANKGLLKAIYEIANSNSIANKLNIQVVDYGLEQQLENSLELTIFRIIQELIANIIKHADATEATIHITNHEDTINIMVEDNGKGFDTKTISKHQGMGIHSIDKRIENLGGTVTIESEINKGTTVIIDIPTL